MEVTEKQRNKKREVLMFIIAIISFLVGAGLSIAGFIVSPLGEISGSVIGAVGEFLSFSGAILGLGSYSVILGKRLKKQSDDENEQ